MWDDLDRQLVSALHRLPRGSFDELASVLGVDASTIRRRLGRLMEEQQLRVVGQVDWAMFSTTLPVHLFITAGSPGPAAVVEQLADLPQVQYLARISGSAQVFATVHAATDEDTSALLDRVHGLAGVTGVESYPVVSAVGRGEGWDPGLLDEAADRCARELAGPTTWEGSVPPRLELAERKIVEALREDGRASAASVGRALGLPSSTAHRVVRRVLDQGWVRPRVEIEPSLLGFGTPFVLRIGVRPGATSEVLEAVSTDPRTRFTTRVAGSHAVVATGLVPDRAALGTLVDEIVGELTGVLTTTLDVVLHEHRRYWMDRHSAQRLGRFSPPPLL